MEQSSSLLKNINMKNSNRRYPINATIFLILIAIGLYQLWLVWPSIIVASVQWQRDVNGYLADLLYDARSNPFIAGGYLMGFSFLYGLLHSLGPGHGKVIVTTYLATHPTKIKASLMLTMISAICQAIVAIVLVSVLIWGFHASMSIVTQKAIFFVSLSFGFIIILGLLICWKAIKQIYRSVRRAKIKVRSLTPLVMSELNGGRESGGKSERPSPVAALTSHCSFIYAQSHEPHSTECGCGHRHVADADAINRASTIREYIGIVATVGVRPCTGAIMVLLFANMVGLYWMGVASAVLMAIGTAFTTSLIALMTLTGKYLIKRYLVVGNSRRMIGWQLASYYAQLIGGLVLVVIGLILIGGLDYGISPMFAV